MILGMPNCEQAFVLTADGQVLMQDLTLPWVMLELDEGDEDDVEVPVFFPIRLITRQANAFAA